MSKNQHNGKEGIPFKEFMTAVGAIAEMALMFYRAVINAGATTEEAMRLLQAFITASLFGGGRNEKKDDIQ